MDKSGEYLASASIDGLMLLENRVLIGREGYCAGTGSSRVAVDGLSATDEVCCSRPRVCQNIVSTGGFRGNGRKFYSKREGYCAFQRLNSLILKDGLGRQKRHCILARDQYMPYHGEDHLLLGPMTSYGHLLIDAQSNNVLVGRENMASPIECSDHVYRTIG